jgi:uncharacterized protein
MELLDTVAVAGPPDPLDVSARLDVTGMAGLAPNARTAWTLGAAAGMSTLLAIALPIVAVSTWNESIFRVAVLGTLAIGTVLIGLASMYAWLAFARFGYALRRHDLVIQSGLWWRSRRFVPRGRIQHVDIDAGPIDRLFGMVDVTVHVAGGLGGEGKIPGLLPETAEWLRAQLIETRGQDV